MQIVFERPGRIRFRFASIFDCRLYDGFAAALPERVSAVTATRANPAARSLTVRYRAVDGADLADVHDTVVAFVAATPPNLRPRPTASIPTERYLRRTLISGTVFAVGMLLPLPLRRALTWAVIAPTLFSGVEALLSRGLCVEALDAAALTIAMMRGDPGTAAATLSFLNLGEYLEATTARSSSELLRHLLVKPPESAWIETTGGALISVPANAIKADDIVVVGPGDMIPVDGQVVEGSATVNESSITGESVPVDREAGNRVLAGGVLEAGRLRIRAVRVGGATTTARIAAFIEQALDKKPTLQSAAERLADQRVVFTLGLGALTFALTRDFSRLASVFLIDYSCALKLGAPVAIKSSLYHGARAGILFKGGAGLEALSQADTVVFDKTGTLTAGTLEVTDVLPLAPAWGKEQLLALLASLEEHATHPVAEAIVEEAHRRALEHVNHDQVEFIVAHGLVALVRGQRVVVGSQHFLEEHEKVPFAAFAEAAERLEAEGKVLLFAAVDGTPAGLIGLRDYLRPEAAATIAGLRASGVRSIALLTGDRMAKAQILADELGLDLVFAEQRPEDKAEVVRQLQAAGRKVAFVGDGVNDAPALVAADVGIAMPRGADLARATADVVLLRDAVDGVATSRAVAAETVALIRSNFRWAVGLNSLLFIAAVTGRISPVASAVLHNGITLGTLLRAFWGPASVRRR